MHSAHCVYIKPHSNIKRKGVLSPLYMRKVKHHAVEVITHSRTHGSEWQSGLGTQTFQLQSMYTSLPVLKGASTWEGPSASNFSMNISREQILGVRGLGRKSWPPASFISALGGLFQVGHWPRSFKCDWAWLRKSFPKFLGRGNRYKEKMIIPLRSFNTGKESDLSHQQG